MIVLDMVLPLLNLKGGSRLNRSYTSYRTYLSYFVSLWDEEAGSQLRDRLGDILQGDVSRCSVGCRRVFFHFLS